MNTPELIDYLAEHAGMQKTEAKKAVQALISGIVEAAARGEEISLNGLGKFKVKDTPARQGRNPATGETIDIPAARKLSFTPAKLVKDRLAQQD